MHQPIDDALTPADAATSSLLATRLTREYGVRHPFVGAGMGFVAMPELVAAVSNAGGIGVLGNAIEPPPNTRALVERVRSRTRAPFGVDFLHDASAFGPLVTDAHVEACAELRVPIVVFHMHVPLRAWVDRLHAAGTRVWMQVASLVQAAAARAVGCDALIAQGAEAGGHNRSSTPLRVLLPRILDAFPDVPVLAAGGIADGEAAFRALAAGADGVWVGTRLVATLEAHAHEEYKRRLVAAGAGDAVTTTMFGPEYPGRPYRVLRNRAVATYAGPDDAVPVAPTDVIGETTLFPCTTPQPYTMPKCSAIVPTPETVGDFEEMALPAGDGVRVVHEVLPAAAVVYGMMADAHRRLARAATHVLWRN